MRSATVCLAAATVAWLAFPAGAAEALSGINDVHLGWMKPADRDAAIADMARSGVRAVRMDLRAPYPAYLDAAEALSKRGFALDLTLDLADVGLSAEHPPVREGRGTLYSVARLSDADPKFFERRFGGLFKEIDRRGIRLTAIEVGNEFNWAAFNGDLAVLAPHQAVEPNAQKVEGLREPDRFREGLRRYVEIVRIAKTLRDASAVNGGAKIVSGGLSDVPAGSAAELGGESVDAAATLRLMIGLGLDKLVDGYGIHFYPWPGESASEIAASFARLASLCTKASPCWVTEWGVAQPKLSCPSDESRRAPTMRDAKTALRQAEKFGLAAADFLYDWGDADDKWAVWRCGALTESGAIALSN